MRSYTFQYLKGQSAPQASVEAKDDEHFWSTVLPAWQSKHGFMILRKTVVCNIREHYHVREPASAAQAA